jgi:hypothetical protein
MAKDRAKSNHETDDSGEEHKKSWRRSWRTSGPVAKLTVVFAGLGAASTTIYAIFAIAQWIVMSDTLKLERPWLGADQERMDISDSTKRVAYAWIRMKNGGRSPAVNMRFNAVFMIGEALPVGRSVKRDELPKNSECANRIPGDEGNVVVPNGDVNLPVGFPREVASRLDDVYNRKVGLYIVGCVDYTDSSGKPKYRTNILMAMIPNLSGGTIVVLDIGNSAN